MDQELVQYLDERFNGLVSALDHRFDDVNERIEEVKRHSGVLGADVGGVYLFLNFSPPTLSSSKARLHGIFLYHPSTCMFQRTFTS